MYCYYTLAVHGKSTLCLCTNTQVQLCFVSFLPPSANYMYNWKCTGILRGDGTPVNGTSGQAGLANSTGASGTLASQAAVAGAVSAGRSVWRVGMAMHSACLQAQEVNISLEQLRLWGQLALAIVHLTRIACSTCPEFVYTLANKWTSSAINTHLPILHNTRHM